jgi:phosphoglycerate dehydrogenase-like enzyme
MVKSKVIVTNMSGVHASPVSEVAMEMMLMLAKRAPSCFYNQVEKKWERYIPMLLRSKTVGIIGLGAIGKEIARLSKGFGMRVIGSKRSAKKMGKAKNIDAVYPLTQLREMLAECDFVVLILPSTPESLNILGEKELRAMKPTAYLVNVGRGDSVDEEAMIRALEKGWIAGAGLDVYTTEPLPPDSKLWGMHNVIISPHVAGRLVKYDEIVTDVFCDNLKRYVNGKRLFNVVNKKRGY